MEPQTRQLLRLLADDLTDRLVDRLAASPALETELQRSMGGSRQTIARRLEELRGWGIVASEDRQTPGKGRPTRSWSLADREAALFCAAADEFLLRLLERRAARHRQAIRPVAGDSGSVTRLPRA
jgi:predicted ArsR family transcriptional regulator